MDMKPKPEPAQERLISTLKQALLLGGDILRRGAKKTLCVSYKSPVSPVTQVDVASEKAIIRAIRSRFPDHGFLAEESDFQRRGIRKKAQPGRWRWIIDPLDGTVNFMHGIPQSVVSIAVERGGVVLAGGVYDPFRRELFLAARGKGATCNGRPIHVSSNKDFLRSLLITGFPYDRKTNADLYLSLIRPFLKKGIDIRRFGAAALDLAWIACGRADGYWEYHLSPWDVAAGALLVEEAGGVVTDFQGRPFNVDSPIETLATNGYLHASLQHIIKKTLALK